MHVTTSINHSPFQESLGMCLEDFPWAPKPDYWLDVQLNPAPSPAQEEFPTSCSALPRSLRAEGAAEEVTPALYPPESARFSQDFCHLAFSVNGKEQGMVQDQTKCSWQISTCSCCRSSSPLGLIN